MNVTRTTLTAAGRCVSAALALLAVAGPITEAGDEDFEFPKTGIIHTTPKVSPGYVLLSPISTRNVFLIDNNAQVVHQWSTDRPPGQAAYLLEDGSLLRAGKVEDTFQFPPTAGSGGRIQKYDWDGNLLWDFTTSSIYRMSHHDIEPLPNGNVLCIVWESFLNHVAFDQGRAPENLIDDVLWYEAIFELKPKGPQGAEIVWKWSLRDHVIQNFDKSKPGYGDPADHPELVDINYILRPKADWVHMNSIDYNAELDQIMVVSRAFSEFWVIDHSTTTEEAKGHTGGRYGRGGDLLYRWGNPRTWNNGTSKDQALFNPHDAHWIPKGLPGAGNVLVFNNGQAVTRKDYSSVDELVLPLNSDGTYARNADGGFGPQAPKWWFKDPGRFYSPRISGAQRLPNGNTLICSGSQYLVMEVTPDAEIVWMYRNPSRFRSPRNVRNPQPSPADLPEEKLNALRIPGGIQPQDGGTLFRAQKYPPDYQAFEGKNMEPLNPSQGGS